VSSVKSSLEIDGHAYEHKRDCYRCQVERENKLIAKLGPPEADARYPLEMAPGAHASTANGYHRAGCRGLGCV
jgi:hypothetical protein